MRKKPLNQSRFKYISTTLLIVFVLFYLAFHAISGDRGVLALIKLQKRANEVRQEVDIVHAERLRLEHKVSLLQDKSLDLDLLDEQARKILGYSIQDEKVYRY